MTDTTTDQGDERRAYQRWEAYAKRAGFLDSNGNAYDGQQKAAQTSWFTWQACEKERDAAQPVAQEASDPINDPEIVAIRTALDWISTGKNSTGKELADRAYLALGRVRAMIAAPQPSQGAQPVVDQKPASMSDNGSCGSQVSGKPVAQEANVKVGGSTVYVTNNHRRESNRWWATVYPGFDDDDKRVSIEECDAIAKRIADALNATPHHPASAEAGKGVEPVTVEAVATVARDGGLDWLIEGGPGALEPGEVLMICAERLTDDTGSGEVYRLPSESVAVSGEVSEYKAPNVGAIATTPSGRVELYPAEFRAYLLRWHRNGWEAHKKAVLTLAGGQK